MHFLRDYITVVIRNFCKLFLFISQ